MSATAALRHDWPAPLAPEALFGIAGDSVRVLAPHTEADPAALLLQFLVAFGNAIGRGPHFRAEADRHALNLFLIQVGDTSKGRKGISWGRVRSLLSVDLGWEQACIKSGLSSGEGLIHNIRDQNGSDSGVPEKRLLVVESEFASTLRVMSRDGNTLSAIIRQAWDGSTLQVLTKQFPERATNPHVSIIGHICRVELRRELTRTEAGNGFANRFLYSAVRRSKCLPDGSHVPDSELGPLKECISRTLPFVQAIGDFELRRDDAAKELWHAVYPGLSAGKPGLLGAVTSRAEAQVMRLACIYALLDESRIITRDHLRAALAVWRYCEDSAAYIFGDAMGDPLADDLLGKLRAAEPRGLTRTDLNNLLGRNRQTGDIDMALRLLETFGRASRRYEETGGRKAERWFAEPPPCGRL